AHRRRHRGRRTGVSHVDRHASTRGRARDQAELQPILPITLAGLPTARTPAGRSSITTEPAPTTVSLPIRTPGLTITPAPRETLSPMLTGEAAAHLSRLGAACTGKVSVRIVTPAPTCTSSPTVTSAWSC